MKMTPQEIRNQFLNSIMKENNVSLKSVYKCMEENRGDIENMDHIFDYTDEISLIKRLVLLSIISRNQAQENLGYYTEISNSGIELVGSDVAKYKVLIITALMFNSVFYVSACNWCGLIRREVIRKNENHESDKKPQFKIVKKEAGLLSLFSIQSAAGYAAAGTGEEFAEFLRNSLIHEGINGTLRFMGNARQEVYIEFIFDEFQNIIPFEMEVHFKTKFDHKDCVITIPKDEKHRKKDRDKGITVIRSDIISGINYSEGIESALSGED